MASLQDITVEGEPYRTIPVLFVSSGLIADAFDALGWISLKSNEVLGNYNQFPETLAW